jgi:hypothetical protein
MLQTQYKDTVELIEYTTVDAEKDKLSNVDYLLIIPPASVLKDLSICTTSDYVVGKGQFTQIITFLQENPICETYEGEIDRIVWEGTHPAILLLHEISQENIYVDGLVSVDLIKGNWKDDYARLELNDYSYNLDHYFGPKVREVIKVVKWSEIDPESIFTIPYLSSIYPLNLKV